MISARTARVLLAASASSVLTAVVALPMAYQAREARQASSVVPVAEAPSVLGTSTVPRSTAEVPGSPTTTSDDAAPDTTRTPTTTTGPSGPGGAPTTTDAPRGSGDADASSTTTSTPRFVAPPPTDAPPTTGNAPSSTLAPPPSTPPTTDVPAIADGLYVSLVGDLQRPIPLVGTLLSHPSFVFLDLPNVAQVEFFLDDEHTATELFAPFELFGGTPMLPLLLEPGTHTVRAEVTFVDGSTTTRVAAFTALGPA